ncbi:hypothetical protein Q3H59_002829 [Pantoea sp. SORGH_AS 659]|nr:hypothetical protein [Pantoea sp. SORGH_AS_0659]
MPLITISTPPKLASRFCRCFHHAAHVVGPHWLFQRLNRRIQREAVLLIVVIDGNHAHLAIIAFGAGNHGLIIDGARQHKAIVVVGVFANQIDAARRLNAVCRLIAESVSENLLSNGF